LITVSSDASLSIIEQHKDVELIQHLTNKGYAGGVNPGFKRAIEMGADYVAPFNNDAVADKRLAETLGSLLRKRSHVGIATCKLLNADGSRIDSTGDYYTTWGLPYPRGRGEDEYR